MSSVAEQKTKKVIKAPLCYHCGEECIASEISIAEKTFCCNGCKLVYELLSEKDLCAYYTLSKTPGSTPREAGYDTRFAYLDDERIIHQMLQYSDGHIGRITLYIPSIHCSSCIWLLENLYKLNEAILNSKVDLLKKSIDITFNQQKITLRQVIELLTSVGYEPEINLASLQKKVVQHTDRDLYIKIGIAGFAFGNIMLLSLPDYLASIDNLSSDFRAFFGYLSILLALPVLLYSSLDYFKSALNGLQQRTLNMDVPISLGIIAIFSRSFIEILMQSGSGYMDSFSGLVFLLLLGKLFQKRTYETLSFERDYRSYFPISVLRRTQDKIESCILSRIKIGDRILIRNHEIVPADSVLIRGDGFIDYSFVTGESEPQHKKSGDLVYAGGKQIGNQIELEVIKEISNSYLTQLWNNPVFMKSTQSRFTTAANRISRYFTFAVLTTAILAALYWLNIDPSFSLNAFTAVLIVACPCALALSTPFTLGNTLRYFGQLDFYLKNTTIIEKMAGIDTIIFDKTGTLTQSQPTRILFQPTDAMQKLTAEERSAIKSLVLNSTHPLSQIIFNYLSPDVTHPVSGFSEIPGQGLTGKIFNQTYKLGSAEYLNLPIEETAYLRFTRIFLTIGDEFRGYFEVKHRYRSGIRSMISHLRQRFEVALLTGDTARGHIELEKVFGDKRTIFFNQNPYDKLTFIQNKQKAGKTVMMIGDGLNDAGALRQSDIGISLTEDVNFFTPASDAILGTKNFTKLNEFIRFSKISLNIIKASFMISFLYNVIGLFFAVQGTLSPLIAAILMPISSVSVILFTTGMTHIWARKIFILKKGV